MVRVEVQGSLLWHQEDVVRLHVHNCFLNVLITRFTVRSLGPASSLSPPEGATSLPPGLITSLHTPVHPLITSLHTPVHPLITSLHTPVHPLITSLHTPVHPLITSLHTPVHPLITSLHTPVHPLITSLHTPVHPLITSLHTPVHLLITLSCSQCVDYLCTSAPSLWLPRLHLPALTCACLYFTVFIIWPITFGFVHSGHQHYVAVWGVPFLIIVLFLPVGFWFNKVKKLTCIWTQISTFPRASMLRCDRSLPQLTVYSS